MTTVRGANVLITGGTLGLGAAIASRVSAAGAAHVSVIARRAPEQSQDGIHFYQADVTDADALDAAITAAEPECDIAISCAGQALPGLFLQVPREEFAQQMRLNYEGAIHMVAAVLPGMVRRGHGHIVLTSSTAGLTGVIGYSGYSATKWALRGFAESLRYEVEPLGIRVTLAYPPDMDTPGFATENLRKPAETVAVSGAISPMAPEDVAAAIVRGIEKNRPHVTADATTRLLVRWGNLLDPLIRPVLSRTIAKSRAERRP